jgi:DNA-binding response OmpR family regulator
MPDNRIAPQAGRFKSFVPPDCEELLLRSSTVQKTTRSLCRHLSVLRIVCAPQIEVRFAERSESDPGATPVIRANSEEVEARRAAAREAEILIVAADEAIARPVVEALAMSASVRLAANAGVMRRVLRSRGIDLLILDADLPGEDAISLCRSVRVVSMVAIIVLVRTGDQEALIAALEAGADDSFSRTTGLREVQARIHSLLRRASFGAAALSLRTAMRFNGWTIDPHVRLLRDPSNIAVELTAAEFDLLWAFCRNQVGDFARLRRPTRDGEPGRA